MHRYTEAETQEILSRAVRAPLDETTSEELQRSAAELGISPESLARAEVEVREERLRKEFEIVLRSKVRADLLGLVAFTAVFATINLLTSPHDLWFPWVVIWWGFSSVATFVKSRDRRGEGYQRAFEGWRAKNGRVGDEELLELVQQ